MDFEEIEIKFKHFNIMCRFCLKKDCKLTAIFSKDFTDFEFEDGRELQTIPEIIELFTGIKVSLTDKFPKNLCTECLEELKGYSQFRNKCIKSQEVLQNVLNLHEMKLVEEFQDDFDYENLVNKIENNSDYDYNDIDDTDYDLMKLDEKHFNTVEVKHCDEKAKTESIKNKQEKTKSKNKRKIKYGCRSGQCQICGKLFKDLNRHIPRHSKNFKCNFCNTSYWTSTSLQRHVHRHHSGKDQYPCLICEKVFTSGRTLRDHLAAIHTKATNYECKECGKKFAIYTSYRIHKERHSNNGPFTCDICEKVFQLKDSYQKHYRNHSAEKCHKCEFCGKSFIRTQTLRDHRRVHTKERPYTCSYCGSAFTQKSSLNLHTKKFHANENKI